MPFSVMTWNVLEGAGARLPMVCSLLHSRQPDVLVLQECLGWETGDALQQVCEAVGVANAPEHCHLLLARPRGSGRRFHVAVVSRFPMKHVRDYTDRHFLGHGLAHLSVATPLGAVQLFGTHYDSHHENLRFVEARYLRSLLDPTAFLSGKYLLCGDLNSLTNEDPYPPDFAEQVYATGLSKYDHPVRYDVLNELRGFGWQDLLRSRGTLPRWWTTERLGLRYRVDYILGSSKMAELVTDAQVVPVGEVSDHDAVQVYFR